MVVDHELKPFLLWLTGEFGVDGALATLILVAALVTLAGVFVGYLVSVLRYDPVEAAFAVARTVGSAAVDLRHTSWARTLALAGLAFREALRRRVLVAFVVFAVAMLLGGWFLDRESDNPAQLYLGFVLTASTYLVLTLALFLSAFSLPQDIAQRTIFTVATKPVRPSEIVLGRIVGFTAIGTVLLVGMCVVSLVFVERGLAHRHGVVDAPTVRAGGEPGELEGRTSYNAFHRHSFTVGPDGVGETDFEKGHWHEVVRRDDGSYEIGPPQGALRARVPVYGQLVFLDREGQLSSEGVNVGYEWLYRSYIEGRTKMAAIWRFSGVTPERFPDGLPLEMTLRVFRTHKGDIGRGVMGELSLRNPETGLVSELFTFTSKEYEDYERFIPRKLSARRPLAGGAEELASADLFDDFVSNGYLDVIVQCSEPGQFFGMARADVYVKAREASFRWNFVKGFIGIWMQMVLVIAFGVMFSTFLSAPVAAVATIGSLVLGFNRSFILGVATGDIEGGGPVESMLRLVTQKNVTIDLEEGLGTTLIKIFDIGYMGVMQAVVKVLPDYTVFMKTADYVAYGYAISPDHLAQLLATMLTYALAAAAVGYFCLKTRELAA